MSDFNYFPEEGYNPDTGEYSNPIGFEPAFEQHILLNREGTVYADVFALPGFEPQGESAANAIEGLFTTRGFEPLNKDRNPEQYPTLPGGFDVNGDNIRGPFLDDEMVQEFLTKSGLRGVAIVYYDELEDQFYIDVNTN